MLCYSLNMHVQLSSGASFGLSLHLCPTLCEQQRLLQVCRCAGSPRPSLLVYAISMGESSKFQKS